MAILTIDNLSISFGGLKAVDDLSFSVPEKSIYGLIGPNGAGKTTVFNCISRFYTPDQGQVMLQGRQGEVDLLGVNVHEVIEHGMVRTFQNVELIDHMSLKDNLLVGMHHGMNIGLVENLLGLGKKKEQAFEQKALEVLDFLGLAHLAGEPAGGQPYGILKLVELGRTLMSDPKIIILDEPAAGMNHTETEELTSLIRKIRDQLGITVLLVEHDMALVMNLCERICAISFGKKIAEGTPEEIQNHPGVQEAYLGTEEEVTC